MSAAEHDLQRRHCPVKAIASLAAFLAAGSLLALGLQALAPAGLPIRTDPTVVELVFNNRGVVLAARLVLVIAALVLAVGGAFIVGSMFVRMRNGDWLKRIGPFEVSETAAAGLADRLAYWHGAALERQRELDDWIALADSSARSRDAQEPG
jgi:hypothetical protein